jgi:hypothetical protein
MVPLHRRAGGTPCRIRRRIGAGGGVVCSVADPRGAPVRRRRAPGVAAHRGADLGVVRLRGSSLLCRDHGAAQPRLARCVGELFCVCKILDFF